MGTRFENSGRSREFEVTTVRVRMAETCYASEQLGASMRTKWVKTSTRHSTPPKSTPTLCVSVSVAIHINQAQLTGLSNAVIG